MPRSKRCHFLAVLCLALAACGGQRTDTGTPQPRMAAVVRMGGQPAALQAYYPLVQQIYVGFFGRAADQGGLDYWSQILQANGAPADLLAFLNASNSNPVLRAVIEGFGNSQESRDRYPGGTDTFVEAIYQNVLSRGSDAGGKAYWSDLIDRGLLSRASAAITLMAGVRGSDADLVNTKTAVALQFTAGLDTQEKQAAYNGPAAILMVRNLMAGVNSSTDPNALAASVAATITALINNYQGYTIDTAVGNGAADIGDGGAATQAILSTPERVLPGASGMLYIADTNNDRVRVVDASGVIRTFAGSGSAESQALGDGGPAPQAVVRFPRGLFETADGLYIGDHTYTVRLVDKTGTINHFALNRGDFIFPWSLVVNAQGSVYLADVSHHRVLRADPGGAVTVIAGSGVAGSTGDGGPAAQAQLDSPSELRFDGPNRLLIGSTSAPLRQIDLSTGVISTRLPQHMAYFDIDTAGNIVYSAGQQVWRVDAGASSAHALAGSTVAGFGGDGGAALQAQLSAPLGVSMDRSGAVYVADSGNNRVRKIALDGSISTFAGGAALPADLASITDTQGLAFDAAGNLFFTDFQHHYLKRIGADGKISIVAGTGVQTSSGDGGPPLLAAFSNPCKLAFDKLGRLYFLDLTGSGGAVRMISPGADGLIHGGADERISTVAGQNISRDLYADHGRADGGPARQAVFYTARYFLFDSHGNLIISDWLDHRIRKVTPGADGLFNGASDEIITTIAGTGATGQSGDGGLATQAAVEGPTRMAIDASDNLYVYVGVNTQGHAIRRIDARTGVITTIASGLDPGDMVINKSNELIYTTLTQVSKIDLATNRTTVIAGTGQSGFSGDGGDALQATFKGASYLALDASDNIYVADNGNFRIRRLKRNH